MNSLDYMKMRITNEPDLKFDISELANSYTFNPTQLSGLPLFPYVGNLNGNTLIEIIYDPDADYQYFTCKELSHDGTTLFIYQTMLDCISKVFEGSTVDNRIKPILGAKKKIYTIGDFVIANQFDSNKWATAEKPWLHQHTIVFLPIIYKEEELI